MAFRFVSAGRAGVALGLVMAFAASEPLAAQDGARAVVQPLPPPEAGQLADALQRLSANPRDLDALIAAGKASLKLDDIDAALGFFTRADEIAPGNARTKAGLAVAMVKEENPFDALRLFDEAERAGASLTDVASERALAFDLVGDNARAQALYRSVLAHGENAEASRRLAVSLAISGDEAEMERILLPMLQRRDLAAYRARAFSLAILGKADEAMTISDAVMPKPMAAKIAPYLRYMKRLTSAQQAAAANLGNFPRTADIGHDDPRVALYAGALGEAAPVRTADARLVPTGAPLGPAVSEPRSTPQRLEAEGGRAVVSYTPQAPEPAPEPAAVPPSPAPEPQAQPPATQVAFATPTPAPSPVEPVASKPAFDLAQVHGSSTGPAVVAAAPSSAPEPPSPEPAPEPRPGVAIAFADFQKALSPSAPAAGAVDLSKIKVPRERLVKEEPKPAKPVPPKEPAREWVQVATGKDRARLAFDWRRISRDSKGVLKDSKGFFAHWGETNRLLTGPFKTGAAAKAFVGKLKEAGVDAFTFSSDVGEEVTPIPGR
jgi:tetratricopeptide (TPR) repeat protein